MRRRKTEVDSQTGMLVDEARRAGVDTPRLVLLARLIGEIERGEREQDSDALDALVPACT